VLLGATVAVALGTGTLAFAVGSPTWGLALAVVHGVAGLVPVVLALRKSRIVRTGWSAARASRWGGAALAVVAVLTVASGLAQALGWRQLGPLSAIQVHVPAAILTGIGVVWHVVVHPPPLRRVVRSRRAITRSLAVGALSAGVWTAVEGAAWALRGFDGRRRWTGSQQVERPLVTQWLDDRPPELDVAAWRLDLGGGRVVALADLLDHPDRREVTAALDCNRRLVGGDDVDRRAAVGPHPTGSRGPQRRGPVGDGVRAAAPERRPRAPAARDAPRRTPAVGRPRCPRAARRPRAARVLVGQVGGLGRPLAGVVDRPAAVPADVRRRLSRPGAPRTPVGPRRSRSVPSR
jgi:hypothetical protein